MESMNILPRGKQIAAPKTEPNIAFLMRQRSEPGTADIKKKKKYYYSSNRRKTFLKFLKFAYSQIKPNVAAVAEPAPTTL